MKRITCIGFLIWHRGPAPTKVGFGTKLLLDILAHKDDFIKHTLKIHYPTIQEVYLLYFFFFVTRRLGGGGGKSSVSHSAEFKGGKPLDGFCGGCADVAGAFAG